MTNKNSKTVMFSGLSYGKQYEQAKAVVEWIVNSGAKDFTFKIEGSDRIEELEHELKRFELLIKIADELITNDNAKKDWENAKQTRIN